MQQYRTALVTGASGGIGAAVVEMLVGLGLEVHGVARRGNKLQALAERTGAIAHVADVTDSAAMAGIVARHEIDILVNNAGTTFNGKLDDISEDAIDTIFDVNVRAVTKLTRLVLPGMRQRNRGHIIMIGSMAGRYPMAGSAPYAASKAAISQMADIIRLDTNGSAIRCTEIVPGRVETDIFGVALGDPAEARRAFLDGKQALLPGDIAATIKFAIEAPERVTLSRIEIYPTRQAVGGFVYSDIVTEQSGV